MSMIIGIQPDNGVKDEPIIEVPGYQVCGEYNSDDPDKNYSLTITRGTRKAESESFELILNSCVYTLSHDEKTFKVVYGISDGKGGYILLNGDSDFYTTMGIAMEDTIEFAPKPGTYTIYALYCEEGDTTWHKCSYDGNLSPFVVTATATELTLEKSGLTATFKPKNNLNGYERNTFEMTITNNSEYDFIGDVNVYYNTSNERPTDVTYNRYIPVAAHSSITRDITLQTTNSGPSDKIYVWVDAANEELISAEEFTIGAIAHPILRLVGVETNATPGEYETENAYYDGSRIKAPKINDDYMKVRYGIKNLGIEGKIRYKISAYDSNEFNFYEKDKGYQTISLPADSSEVYYLEETWTPEEMNGARTILTTLYLRLFDSDTKPTVRIADDIRYTYIDLIDEGSKLELKIEWPVCYVAGKPAGIDNIKIADGVTIAASKGEIVVRTDKAESLTVYSVDGRLITQVAVEAGSEKSISLPTGVYVANGQKVVVR